jgi:hypothetical protein
MPGHVHVVAGDITKIGCDAWLLPTDGAFTISGAFAEEIGLVSGQRLANQVWDGSRVIRLEQSLAGRPQVWLANVGRNPGDPRNEGSWYADVIEPFARSAKEGLEPTGVPPLLAIPVLGTGDGGMAADRERSIGNSCQNAVRGRVAGVDLVLVCGEGAALGRSASIAIGGAGRSRTLGYGPRRRSS